VYACSECVRRFADVIQSRWFVADPEGKLKSSAVAIAAIMDGAIPSTVLGIPINLRWFVRAICNANLLLILNHSSCCKVVRKSVDLSKLSYVPDGLGLSKEKLLLVPIDKAARQLASHDCARRRFVPAGDVFRGTVTVCNAAVLKFPLEEAEECVLDLLIEECVEVESGGYTFNDILKGAELMLKLRVFELERTCACVCIGNCQCAVKVCFICIGECQCSGAVKNFFAYNHGFVPSYTSDPDEFPIFGMQVG